MNREHRLSIIKSNFDEDVYRMIRFLLSNATLEVRLQGETISSFTSNSGSPQGNGITGILFKKYLEDALQRARAKVIQNNQQIEHCYSKVKKVSLAAETIYADDTDIFSTDQKEKAKMLYTICEIFPEGNLQINVDKTEHTIMKRGKKKEEPWGEMKRLKPLLSDKEDIPRRKQLSIPSMNNMEKVCIRTDHISEKARLKLLS